MAWLSKVWAFVSGLVKREPDLVAFLTTKSPELKALEKAVVDAVVAAKGGPVDLLELYDGIAAAKKVFAEKADFVAAFSHFVTGK